MFLQGQLTVDIREISPTQHRLGALCNNKGRIRALFRIFKAQDTYYLQLPRLVLPHAMTILKKFAKFSKVMIEDVSETWQRFGIWTQDLTSPALKAIEILKSGKMRAENDILHLSLSDLYPRFELLMPSHLPKPIWKHFGNLLETNDFDAWKLLDINAGIPEIWSETIEQLLPHDINLPGLEAVSFTKGCYCGQEIVARMEYRANLKRKMYPITLSNTKNLPLPGSKIALPDNPEVTGTVVTAAFSAPNTAMVLLITSL